MNLIAEVHFCHDVNFPKIKKRSVHVQEIVEILSGNVELNLLSTSKPQELRIDMMDMDENTVFALYDSFQVDSETNYYKLSVGIYSGTAGGE